MASQTSALISALRLHRPAVLGWSMGGMIAQDLAVTHPAQVSRLILAATTAGTGKALPLPSYTAAEFSLSPAKQTAVLFPANQAAAARAYLNAIQQYAGSYGPSAATSRSQVLAVDRWLAGQDPAGRLARDIRVPTLVAGGARDRFMPVANERLLGKTLLDLGRQASDPARSRTASVWAACLQVWGSLDFFSPSSSSITAIGTTTWTC